MLLRKAILTASIAVAATGQPATWAPPVLGYFYDGTSNAIRMVAGVPGAASIDGAVPSAAKLRAAFVAPGRKFAIARTIDEGSLLLDWSRGDVAVRDLASVVDEVSSVAFSPRGAEAAVASKSLGKMQIWRGLPDNPALERELAVSPELFAVSDDGQLAWIDSSGVFTLDGDTPKLLAAGSFSAIAFRPGTQELAAAGRYNDSVVSLRAGGDGSPVTLASSDDGIAEPVGLRFSADATQLIVANARSRSATILNIAAHSATTLACDCDPALVSGAAGNAVFRITAATGVPLVYVDAGTAEPRIFHVPVSEVSR
jgi:hypothetical protein